VRAIPSPIQKQTFTTQIKGNHVTDFQLKEFRNTIR